MLANQKSKFEGFGGNNQRSPRIRCTSSNKGWRTEFHLDMSDYLPAKMKAAFGGTKFDIVFAPDGDDEGD